MPFCSAESRLPDETLSGGAGADVVVAEVGATTSFPAGAGEEAVGEAVAPEPNCPARKTWAALASFDLMSCAAAGFCELDDEAADAEPG